MSVKSAVVLEFTCDHPEHPASMPASSSYSGRTLADAFKAAAAAGWSMAEGRPGPGEAPDWCPACTRRASL